MKDINTFVLIGRLTRDPEIKMTASGVKVATFDLAVGGGKSKNDEEITHFFPLTFFRSTAEVIERYCKKGMRVAVQGHIILNTYQSRDGNKISKIVLEGEEIQFLEKAANQSESKSQYQENDGLFIDEDDLPF